MTGKLADVVMSVRNGEQLARKYQPIVYNPSTPAQIAQRAKLKLLSQLSAVFGPSIAIPREGSVSSRNLFTKLNYPLTSFDQTTEQASVALDAIQVTKSSVAAPSVFLFTRRETAIPAGVSNESLPAGTSRVVYILCKKIGDSLVYVDSKVATAPGASTHWDVEFPLSNDEMELYVYAVRDNTETARAKFGELQAVTAETIAKLLVTRTITEADVTLTRTAHSHLPAVGRDAEPDVKKKK